MRYFIFLLFVALSLPTMNQQQPIDKELIRITRSIESKIKQRNEIIKKIEKIDSINNLKKTPIVTYPIFMNNEIRNAPKIPHAEKIEALKVNLVPHHTENRISLERIKIHSLNVNEWQKDLQKVAYIITSNGNKRKGVRVLAKYATFDMSETTLIREYKRQSKLLKKLKKK